MTGKCSKMMVWLVACIKNWIKSNRMVIIAYQLMFWAEIHLQPDRHVFDGNDARKSVTILHNIAQVQFLFYFFS